MIIAYCSSIKEAKEVINIMGRDKIETATIDLVSIDGDTLILEGEGFKIKCFINENTENKKS